MKSPARSALTPLALTLAAVFSSTLAARELGNFDINTAAGNKRAVAGISQTDAHPPRIGRDALGRATFSWVQQDLSAAAKAVVHDPESAARAHLGLLLDDAKHRIDAATALKLHKIDTQRGGARLVQFKAQLQGIQIFREDLALLLDRDQRLVAMRGPLPDTSAAQAKSLPAFRLSAAEAIAAALKSYDFPAEVAGKLRPGVLNGAYQHFELPAKLSSASGAVAAGEQRARRVYYRTSAGLQPAWYVETQIADSASASGDLYGHVISAVDGSTLFRKNHTAHADSFSYRVWAENSSEGLPYPSTFGRNATPDPDGLPTNNVVATIPQVLRSLANAPFSRSATDGWLAPGASTTNGNNVRAYADLVAPSGLGDGDLLPAATSPGSFDYLYDVNLSPGASATQSQAATVNLFYVVNWLHDWFYDHGFSETDGNAQLDNYGRGGLGGDLIRAEAQDYDVMDNANMATPSDGFSPRMQMGLWGTSTVRDSSLDATIIAHEWGHYLSNRLVLDANGLDTQHASGMGEGWSDVLALLIMTKEEDRLKPGNANFAGAYASAGYAANDSYYGVRRYPYSTDMSKSPLTLGHLTDGSFLPSSPPPRFFGSNTAIHGQGEVWALALWEAYVAMLNDTSRLSFNEAQSRMKDYLVAGMKMTPGSPTMVEARDAILASILASGQTADFALFTAAFAKRGLGAGALIPDRYSSTNAGLIESTQQGADIAVAAAAVGIPTGCDADTVLDVGDTAMVSVTVRNTGFTTLSSATATLSSSNPALVFPNGPTIDIGSVPLFGSKTASIPVRLASTVPANSAITITATPNAAGINAPPGAIGSTRIFVNYDQIPQASSSETFDGNRTTWRARRDPAGTGTESWIQREENGQFFLHGSDLNSNSVNWIESPQLAVGSGPLTITLNHRHAFETDANEFYDGGVIQASIDGGVTWTDVDAAAAGYSTGALSACCGNPLAGKRGYLHNSALFPNFRDQVINFGTTYANQANFRLRFGVATDAASNGLGWDINTVTFSGLTNTPFDAVSAQAANCSLSNGKSLQGALGGTYYSAQRSGEGVLVDFGQVGTTPVVFFTWYTYADGEQQWLVGSKDFATTDKSIAIDLISTRGASFGSGFQPSDVVRSSWGSAALSFTDCNTMTLNYQKATGERGTQTLSRLFGAMPAGQCGLLHGGLSGTYYSPSRSGEGVLVDFGQVNGTPIQFFTWYTYGSGSQQWLVGSHAFSAGDSMLALDLVSTQGASFGDAFNPGDVIRTPWGTVTQRFPDCNTLELSYQKAGGESGTQTLTRVLGRLETGQCQ